MPDPVPSLTPRLHIFIHSTYDTEYISPRISCRFSSVFSGSPVSPTSALRPLILRISWLAAIQSRSLLPPRTLLLFYHDPLPHSSSLGRSDATIARDRDLSPTHPTTSEMTTYPYQRYRISLKRYISRPEPWRQSGVIQLSQQRPSLTTSLSHQP